MKNKIIPIFVYMFPVFAIILCLFAKETSQVAKNAIYLCLDIVIPSLFPFFVISKVIIPYISLFPCPKIIKRFIERIFYLPYYTVFIILLGFISGYPSGAKMTRDMLDEKLIDSKQASKLLPMANNSSPLFIVGTIGAGLFKSVKLGVFLLIIHWISGLTTAIIIGRLVYGKRNYNSVLNGEERNKEYIKITPATVSLPALIASSIEEAAILCIKVSGYIVFFAVISELLSLLGVFSLLAGFFGLLFTRGSQAALSSEFITAILKGLMEITSGAQAVYNLKNMQLNIQLAVISIIFGFAGFSVHTQIMGIMKGTGCKYRVLFLGKLLHGIIAGILTFLAIGIMPISVQVSGLEVVSGTGLLWTRPIVILVLILSLIINPYRISPPDRKSINKDKD